MVRQIVIDTETTGYDPYKGNHRIVEIALIEVIDNKVTGKSFQSYFNPQGKRSTKGAYDTHKIKDGFLLGKPLFGDRLDEIIRFINNDEIIFYNKKFDLKFMDHEALLAGSEVVFSKDYKSVCLQEYVAKNLGRVVSLDKACVIHHVDNSQRVVHGALIDTKLTAELLVAINTNSNKSLTSVPNENKFSDTEKFAFPRAYKDVQLNFCKNTQCSNYGIPPNHAKMKKNGKFTRISGDYTLRVKRRKGRDDETNLICKLCGSSNKLISNKGFVQEVERLRKNSSLDDPSCLNTGLEENKKSGRPDGRRYKNITKTVNRKVVTLKKLLPPCSSHNKGILSHPELYWLDSKNKSTVAIKDHLPQMSYPDINGNSHVISELVSQTFKCKECHSKFTVAITPHKGQSYHQVNHGLFLLLINKEPFSRCMEVFNISMENIYQRIKFFYKQCVQFDQYHLNENLSKLNEKTLNLSMDRQHFYSNWSDKSDKRRTKIVNISTIDNSSRFVLASTLNFDFTSDYKKLRKEFIRIGEYTKYQQKRRYPQYVLPEEIVDGDPELKPPVKNLLLQQTYSTMAHLEYLKLYFDKLEHINLFADNDTGFEMAVTRVCSDLIKSQKLTCALIRDSKLEAKDEIEKEGCYYWIKQEAPVIENNFIDLKFLTSYEESNVIHASLYGIDSYFQLNRRRISMVERPIPTSSKTEKKNKEKIKADEDNKQIWNLYGSYNPKYVSMLIEILRVYNNYILTDKKSLSRTSMNGKTPRTPAQKIGLVEQPYSVHDILEFSPAKIFLDKHELQKKNINLA